MNSQDGKNKKKQVSKKLILSQSPPPQEPMSSNLPDESIYATQAQDFSHYSSQYQAFLLQNNATRQMLSQANPYMSQHPSPYMSQQPYMNPHPNAYMSPSQNPYMSPPQNTYMGPPQNQGFYQNFTRMLQVEVPTTQDYNPEETVQEVTEMAKEGKAAAKKKGKGKVDKEGVLSKKKCFTPQEDIILAEVYVRATDDAKNGCDQTAEKYWQKIANAFNAVADERGMMTRPEYSLKNRMEIMKYQMVRWNEAVEYSRVHHKSGFNVSMELEEIRRHFMRENKKGNNRPFAFHHVLNILKTCSKFSFTTTRSAMGNNSDSCDEEYEEEAEGKSPEDQFRTPTNSGSEHASTHGSGHIIHSGEKRSSSDVTSPSKRESKRPMGSKAAKLADKKKKNKAKGREDASESVYEQLSMARKEEFARYFNERNERTMERTKVLADIARIEQEKVDVERAKEERQRESDILNLDIELCTTQQQRDNLNRRKQAIMDKWFGSD